jgi:hypothetical protein
MLAQDDGSECRAKSLIAGDWQKHTTGGIPRWSLTLVLVARFSAYVWQSGRSAWISLHTQLRRWHAPTHPHVIQEDGFREGSSRLTPGR